MNPKKKRILIGSGIGIIVIAVAIALVVTLVVLPRQRAQEQRRVAEAQAQAEHDDAAKEFETLTTAIRSAEASLKTQITAAEQVLAEYTDAELTDAGLLTKLQEELAAAAEYQPVSLPSGVSTHTAPACSDLNPPSSNRLSTLEWEGQQLSRQGCVATHDRSGIRLTRSWLAKAGISGARMIFGWIDRYVTQVGKVRSAASWLWACPPEEETLGLNTGVSG